MWPFRWTMLASSPKNGVELMDEIERMTQGWWRPSPGSVYPVLEQLTKDGMVKKREDGRYELTEKASDELEGSFGHAFGRRERSVDEMFDEVGGLVSYMEELVKSDPAKLKEHREQLQALADRLSTMLRD
jgi:DNA-binding PadR family transcriptional regulator